MGTAGTCASARSVSMAGANQRINLQSTMQRSNPEDTVGQMPKDDDGEILRSSKTKETSASSCLTTSADCPRQSGRVCWPGDGTWLGWQEQTEVVLQPHSADTPSVFEQPGRLSRRVPALQLWAGLEQHSFRADGVCVPHGDRLAVAQQHGVDGKNSSGSTTAASQTNVFDADCLGSNIGETLGYSFSFARYSSGFSLIELSHPGQQSKTS